MTERYLATTIGRLKGCAAHHHLCRVSEVVAAVDYVSGDRVLWLDWYGEGDLQLPVGVGN